ncbi:MAG: restriction endonuclease subunit S [Planctomycetaceae bacterium]|jgi:restriction endonuclease S subunit|nr:restriction endonuclease subunit S [Planctomycetaceae bacterium]
MKVKIADIVDFLPSFSFRARLPACENGAVKIIQMKNIKQNGEIDWNRVVRVPSESHYEKYFLQTGDVLFLGRGERNVASVIGNDFPMVMTASYFTAMRLVDKHVLPEYLVFFLNHSKVQMKLYRKVSGTTVSMIPANELAQLSINIPPLKIQHQIAEIGKLQCVAEGLESKIQEKRRILIERKIYEIIK